MIFDNSAFLSSIATKKLIKKKKKMYYFVKIYKKFTCKGKCNLQKS